MRKLTATLVLVMALVLAACAPAATQAPPQPTATAAPTQPPAATEAPASQPTAMPTPADSGMSAEPQDIVDLAIADGRFTTLVAAVQAAGLVDTLKGEGPFTVFAPTEDAFAKLPAGTLDDVLANPEQLKDILLYHVVSGEVMAADVLTMDGKSAETALAGKSISITIDGDKVMLNDTVMVVITDIVTTNGVIHVIDSVLLPPEN